MAVPLPLHLRRDDAEGRALITLAGEIDVASAPLIRDALARCLRDGIRTIDIDLTDVTFCDCSGLSAFLDASQLTTAAGGSLRLRSPSPAMSRLLALTHCESLLALGQGFPVTRHGYGNASTVPAASRE